MESRTGMEQMETYMQEPSLCSTIDGCCECMKQRYLRRDSAPASCKRINRGLYDKRTDARNA